MFRFRLPDLRNLIQEIRIPALFQLKGDRAKEGFVTFMVNMLR
jgi:hypothetical protein